MRGKIVVALVCAGLVAGCATARPDASARQPSPAGPPASAAVAPVGSTPAVTPAAEPGPGGSPIVPGAAPSGLPSGRTPSQLRPTASPAATPFRVNGIVLVNRQHPLAAGYVPPYDTSDHLSPDLKSALTRLFAGASAAGYELFLRSGYRSYAEQKASYTNAVAQFGHEVADSQFAPPGASEHQTGLSVDLAAPGGYKGYEFKKLPVAAWVAEHATDYGLIVRYPSGGEAITGYDWEAWHVRYVGSEVAAEFARRPGLTLEEYLGVA